MTNPYADAARQRKATRLAVYLDGIGVDADTAAALDRGGWDAAAGLAGVHPPSEEARAMVVALLRDLPAIRAALPADPFEGLA